MQAICYACYSVPHDFTFIFLSVGTLFCPCGKWMICYELGKISQCLMDILIFICVFVFFSIFLSDRYLFSSSFYHIIGSNFLRDIYCTLTLQYVSVKSFNTKYLMLQSSF